MEIKQLIYFREVALREHISEAALELEIAQSAVSRQIANLEKELNTTLFLREGRNVKLTDSGELLLSQANRILNLIDETKELFIHQDQTDKRSIKLAYTESYVSQALPAIIKTYERDFNIEIRPMMMTPAEIEEALLSHQIDVALSELTPKLSNNKNTHKHVLFEETYNLYVHNNNDLSMNPKPPLSQLSHQYIYHFNTLPDQISQLIRKHASQKAYPISNFALLRQTLLSEKGVLIIPDYLSNGIEDEHLTKIPLTHTELKRTIHIVYQNNSQNNQLKTFIEHTRSLLQRQTTYH
ncbi:glutamate biosynthesis transcriptional regulator GltC [Mammaliicoccus vitulinus]|uniref:LysR family transcriptional regulator n=1 Tax=Mammaliicoccus vitulinus TaxID=71237 RepID=A0A2T4PWZ7_9STAP|nr:LysR family transcriptional regulator [Mammaliicoccus vitulinus]HAL10182.1 LysR family transcriptional regulator [Staphylococcus sp.]MBM6630521.1 LysR family transcriptional regulator [Mammaliicoccus vitulinus]MBO3077664.1 LysR family transcriptional regulator [Mammaliicoccus vitulinus]MEB7658303.1 LysR family transcriptional regulator [Mammaliicoccus vitulinus]PTI31035.1 LysR family transcriptional regulator [Mammaliicoccus vitulinus]